MIHNNSYNAASQHYRAIVITIMPRYLVLKWHNVVR